MPHFLQPHIGAIRSPIKAIIKMERMMNATNLTINVRYQSYTGGATYYDTHQPTYGGGPNFTEVYHHVWKVLFTPHPMIATMVQDQLQKLQLQPHRYASIHVRAHYRVEKEKRATKFIQSWAPHAVTCASALLPGGPYFMASDSMHAIRVAQAFGTKHHVRVAAREEEEEPDDATAAAAVAVVAVNNNKQKNKKLVRVNPTKEPLHLDMSSSHRQHASDYYDTFVDLYLLALGKCVSYGVGGFGTWALLISANATCGIKHYNGQSMLPCQWHEKALAAPRQEQTRTQKQQQQQQQQPSLEETNPLSDLFRPPIKDESEIAM
jgi:hypothetical protein